MLEYVSISAIFKDLRKLEKYNCCNEFQDMNLNFIDTEVKKRIIEKKIDDIVFVIKSSSMKNSKIKKNEITKNLILKNLEFSPERCKLEKEKKNEFATFN